MTDAGEGIFVLVAFGVGWALAQLIKCILVAIRGKGEIGWAMIMKKAFKSGGMPSGHTACLTAVATFLFLTQGLSTEFALAACVLTIVAYDAVNVRHAVGEQGKMLKDLMHRRAMRIVEGHTVPQMLVGFVLGVAVGAGVFVAWKLMVGGGF